VTVIYRHLGGHIRKMQKKLRENNVL